MKPDRKFATKIRTTFGSYCQNELENSFFFSALWFHNVKSLESWTISVNIFWRNLESEFYDPNDVYGNKDLVPFSKSIGQLAKSLNELKKQLPPVYFDFYARRLGLFIDKTIETHRTKK